MGSPFQVVTKVAENFKNFVNGNECQPSRRTFYQDGKRVFWDVHYPEKTIVIDLHGERYNELSRGSG